VGHRASTFEEGGESKNFGCVTRSCLHNIGAILSQNQVASHIDMTTPIGGQGLPSSLSRPMYNGLATAVNKLKTRILAATRFPGPLSPRTAMTLWML
jgi:hypothetical protein